VIAFAVPVDFLHGRHTALTGISHAACTVARVEREHPAHRPPGPHVGPRCRSPGRRV